MEITFHGCAHCPRINHIRGQISPVIDTGYDQIRCRPGQRLYIEFGTISRRTANGPGLNSVT